MWSFAYTLVSMGIGFVLTRLLRLPAWVTPAICFNNTTSLPLLLIQSLDVTGVLSSLLIPDADTTPAAIKRAKSYFLVCSIVSNSLTFARGPKLLDGEDSPDEDDDKKEGIPGGEGINGSAGQRIEDIEHGLFKPIWLAHDDNANGHLHGIIDGHANGHANQDPTDDPTEETSLLPDTLVRHADAAGREVYNEGKKGWDKLPHWAQALLEFLYAFLNGPLIGAAIGALVGLVSSLHRVFFADQVDGGIFTGWLTSSLANVGGLFASLQVVVVVGVKLSGSLRRMKRGEESGKVPWVPMCLVLGVRFLWWPM